MTTAAYLEALGQSTLEPRYVVAIEVATGDTTYITSHSDAYVPTGTVAIDRIDGAIDIKGISGQTQKISPDTAKHTIGNVSFNLLDVNQEISTKIKAKLDGGDGLRKKEIRLYKGESTLTSWDDYALLLTYQIDDIKYKNGVYRLSTSDIQRTAKKTIMNLHQGALTSTITATQMTIPISIPDALNKFPTIVHDSIFKSNPSLAAVGYIKIDDEIIAHSGWNGGGTELNVIQRGALSTKEAIHEVDAGVTDDDKKKKVEEYIYLEMASPKMIYAILTGVLAGQAATLPDHWHLGIPLKYVDLAGFQNLGTDLWDTSDDTGRIARFMGLKKENGKDFIEKELALWGGFFLRITEEGKYTPKRLSSVLPFSAYSVFVDDSEIMSYSDLNYDLSSVINDILIDWNWLDQQERFTKSNQLIDANSIAKYSDAKQKAYEFRGVFTGAHTGQDLTDYFNVIRDRYAAPPLRLNLTLMPKWDTLQVGDTIRARVEQIWDTYAGDVLDRVFEVQGKKIDWISGRVSVDLFGGVEPASTTATSTTNVMQDSFYTATGIDLATELTIVAGVVTASGSLTGGNLTTDAIYYYNGDLEIGSGVTVTCSKNVQLRIKGFLTITGNLDFTGTTTQTGNVGITYTRNPALLHQWERFTGETTLTIYFLSLLNVTDQNLGGLFELPSFPLSNPDGLSLSGVPTNLLGMVGVDGADAKHFTGGIFVPSGAGTSVAGGAGGAGGGGGVIICRGAAFNPSGTIDTSGGDGVTGSSLTTGGRTVYGQTGAGGYPGAVLFLIDGNNSEPVITNANSSALNGASADPAGIDIYAKQDFTSIQSGDTGYGQTGLAQIDKYAGLIKYQFIPPPFIPFERNPADEEADAVGYGSPPPNWADVVDDGGKPENNAQVNKYSQLTKFYIISATQPTTPSTGSGSVVFPAGTTTPPASWSLDVPSGTGKVWSTFTTYVAQADGTDDGTNTFPTPRFEFEAGANLTTATSQLTDDAALGETATWVNVKASDANTPDDNADVTATSESHRQTVYFYKLLTDGSTPATPATGSGEYNFSTGVITNPAGWSSEPPDGDGILWQTRTTFRDTGTPGADDGSNIFATPVSQDILNANTKYTSNITVSVGSGGDYLSIPDALEGLSAKFPTYASSNLTATINILSGHVITDQLIVDQEDFSWVQITSVDTTVTENITTWNTLLKTEFNNGGGAGLEFEEIRAVFAAINGGKMPLIKFRLSCTLNGIADQNGRKYTPFFARGVDSLIKISPYEPPPSGFWYGATFASGVNHNDLFGAYASDGGKIFLSAASQLNDFENGVFAEYGGIIAGHYCWLQDCHTYGITAENGGFVDIIRPIIKNASTAVNCSNGSVINIPNAGDGGSPPTSRNLNCFGGEINAPNSSLGSTISTSIAVGGGGRIYCFGTTTPTSQSVNIITSDGLIMR